MAYRSARNALAGLREQRPAGPAAVITALGAIGVALCITVLWWNMRAVMEVGGTCAEGGPYVIDTPCPDGAAWMIPLSIPLGMAFTALWVGGLALLDGRATRLAILAWGALFGSLGWNFLEYAFDPPGGGGPSWSWLACGVIFVVMALPGLAVLPGAIRQARGAGRRHAAALALTAAGAAIGIWLGTRLVDAAG